jgi:hypothetical protein
MEKIPLAKSQEELNFKKKTFWKTIPIAGTFC